MSKRFASTCIGVSGHQSRSGIDWGWTSAELHKILLRYMPVERAFTSLAIGSDQIFAREALALKIPVTAIIPLPNYERFFRGHDLDVYNSIRSHCEVIILPGHENDERSFFEAGCRIVDSANLLVAIWDGHAAIGFGGTADIVGYCRIRNRTVIHMNPITRVIQIIDHAEDTS